MAIHAEVSTLEVSIASSAEKAITNLDALAKRLDSLEKIVGSVVQKAGGLATIGKVDTKNIKDVLDAARNLGKSFADIDKKKPNIIIRTENLEKARKKLDDLFDGAKGKTNIDIGRDKSNVEKNIALWEKELDKLYQKFEQIGQEGDKAFQGKEFRSVADQIVNITNALGLANDALADWDAYLASMPSLNASETSPGLEGQQNTVDYGNVSADVSRMTASVEGGSSALDRFGTKIATAFSFVRTFASYLGGTLKKSFDLVRNAIHSVRNALGKMSSAFKSALSSVKAFAHGLAHPISTLKSMFGMGGRSGGGLLGGLLRGRSLGQFIGLIVLRRAVMAALRSIVNGIKEGFENIRNYSSAINSEMNSIQNSLLYVKNAWAAAFAPIVSVVRPYINYLLDAIAAALNALGRLVAMLTGKGFAVQAVKLSDAMYEAGKAGEAAAGGTGKAAKAAEDYKKTIMGFDQLHVLNAQDSGSGGSGGGGGGGGGANGGLNVNDMFTTVSLAGAFKDAIDSEDWEELGRLMAEKVNSAFGKLNELISWENVGDKITKTVNAITTTLNSLVDNVDWNLIGTTVGSGINTLVNTWNLFFDGFDFINLGTKIAEGVNGLFDRVDWTALGRAVTQKFKALWETISGFVSTLNWGNVGVAIGDALNGALHNISLPDIGATIGKAISGASVAIKNFTLTFDWDEAFSQVKGFFVNLLSEINESDLLDSIGGVAAKIATGLAKTISDPEVLEQLETFASNLGEKLGSLEWVKYLGELALAIVEALEKLLTGLLEGFVKGLLIKLGVSQEDADAAFEDKDAFEMYNLTGDPRWLPNGEFYEAQKQREVEVTAKATHFVDATPPEERVVNNSKANVTTVTDKTTAAGKTFNNGTLKATAITDACTGTKKTFAGGTLKVGTLGDSVSAAKKTFGNGKLNVNKLGDYVAAKNKVVSNATAKATKLDPSGIPSSQKKINVTANITKTSGGSWKLVPKASGGLFKNGSWKPITRYASGGSPQSAELFMAREAGPELVGRIGSSTAVMNNNQIVSSVASGVKQAVAEAIIATRGLGSNDSMPYQINVTVKTQNDEVLAKAVERGNAKRRYRLGTSIA